MSATFIVDLGNSGFSKYSYFGTIASNTTTNGDAVDCQPSDGTVHALAVIGDAGDATTVITIKLQECDTSGGTYADISGATTTLTASATANDKSVVVVQAVLRSKRYVRAVVVTASGSSISVPIAVAVVSRKKIVGTGNGAQL